MAFRTLFLITLLLLSALFSVCNRIQNNQDLSSRNLYRAAFSDQPSHCAMLTSALALAAALLSFVLPFLLTLKCISDTSDPVKTSHRALFLLHYWLCFWFVGQIQTILSIASLAGFPLSTDTTNVLFAAIKCWLFYGHGCLMIPRIFLQPFVGRYMKTQSFGQFERWYVEPAARIIPMSALASLDLGPLAKYARLYTAYTQSGTSFLAFCLDGFCYIDSDSALAQRYHNLRHTIVKILRYLRFPVNQQITTHRERSHSQSFSPKLFQLLPPQGATAQFAPENAPMPRSASKTYNLDLDFFTRLKNDHSSNSPRMDFSDTEQDMSYGSVDDSMEVFAKAKKSLPRVVRKVDSIPSLSSLADELPLLGSRLRSQLTSKPEKNAERTPLPASGSRSVLSPQHLPYPLGSSIPSHPIADLLSGNVESTPLLKHQSLEPTKVRKMKRKEPPNDF